MITIRVDLGKNPGVDVKLRKFLESLAHVEVEEEEEPAQKKLAPTGERREVFRKALHEKGELTQQEMVGLNIVSSKRSLPAFLASCTKALDGTPFWVSEPDKKGVRRYRLREEK